MQPFALLVIIKGKSLPTNWFEEKFLQLSVAIDI